MIFDAPFLSQFWVMGPGSQDHESRRSRTVLFIEGDVEDSEAHWCLSFRKGQMQPPIAPEMVKSVAIGSQEGGCKGWSI